MISKIIKKVHFFPVKRIKFLNFRIPILRVIYNLKYSSGSLQRNVAPANLFIGKFVPYFYHSVLILKYSVYFPKKTTLIFKFFNQLDVFEIQVNYLTSLSYAIRV